MATRRFSGWTPWNGRHAVEGRNQAGVYLLARFDNAPPTTVEPISFATIFIGETHAQTLEARWQQFHACAFECKTGHSPGITFNQEFLNGEVGDVPPWLYVATMPLEPDEAEQADPIKRQLLRDYSARFGGPPVCNVRPE